MNWYPGAVLGGSDWILGNLFGGVTEETLAELDEYEGPHEFRRVETEAWLADGERVRCWIYEYAGPVNEARRIDSGEFTG